MIRDKNLECFEGGTLDLSKVGNSTATYGRVIKGQNAFKTPFGAKIPGSNTPWGRYGARFQVFLMKGVPQEGSEALKPQAFSGSESITFTLYDGPKDQTIGGGKLSHVVVTLGPFTGTELAAFQATNFEDKPFIDVAIPATAQGYLQVAAACSSTAGSVKGGVYPKIMPNI